MRTQYHAAVTRRLHFDPRLDIYRKLREKIFFRADTPPISPIIPPLSAFVKSFFAFFENILKSRLRFWYISPFGRKIRAPAPKSRRRRLQTRRRRVVGHCAGFHAETRILFPARANGSFMPAYRDSPTSAILIRQKHNKSEPAADEAAGSDLNGLAPPVGLEPTT
ncbi:MAG: hypothetical protein LBS85_00655, partial [Clostridiales Family XIII bacterium]|nr:hypothetical protein [Clostridiales Family XIII bacterium]